MGMDANRHYVRDGRPFGPFTLDQMRQLASSGLLSPTDMVKSGADGVWVSAGTVPGLTFPPAPPAPPASVAADRTGNPPGDQPEQPPRPSEPTLAPKQDPLGKRSLSAMLVVWAAVAPLALVLVNQVVPDSGGRLPAAVLGAGGLPALVTWICLGVWAVLTGGLPTFTGRTLRRPFAHRVGGLAILYAGWGLFAALWNESPDRGPTPAAGDAAYERVSFAGGEEVLYRPGRRADAERLAGVLRDLGEFNGQSSKAFAVEARDGGWAVKVVTTDAARRNPAVHAFYRHSLGVRIAARAFPGSPVEFQFCDPELASQAVVALPAVGFVEIQGKDTVYYLGPLGVEAGRMAAFVKPRLGPAGERGFVLWRPASGWSLAVLNADADALTPEAEQLFTREANDLSRSVFSNAPVEVVVYDRTFQPKRTFRSAIPLILPTTDTAWPFGNPQNPDQRTINWDDYRESSHTPWKKSP